VKDIYSAILDSIKTGRPSVLATLVSQRGSSPRGAGAKMLILEDGYLNGSIGGGILEKAVIEASARVFASSLPVVFKGVSEMSCGGDVEVFLEPASPDNNTFVNTIREVSDIIRRGGSGLLATALDEAHWQGGRMPKALFKSSGEVTGFLPNIEETRKLVMNEMPSFLNRKKPGIIACRDNEGNEFNVFIEPLISDPVLYVFGAGHVSAQVVPLAKRVGFKVIVIDDRPAFSDPLNFPDAEKVLHSSHDGVFKKLSVDEASYIVIATRGHDYDQLVLGQALRTEAGYIGMIGSRRKISTIFDNLSKEGFQREDLARVHSPIGLDIGAETPVEIALSIVAELVKVRAEG
jgi:xanthine dehydrogenase accessory factor